MKSFLRCQGLTKAFKGFTLGPLDLDLEEGWFYALVGPNGAGKTTWMRLLLTLSVPTSGGLTLWDLDPWKNEVAVKRRIGFVLDGQFDQTNARWDQVGRFLARMYPDWDSDFYSRLVHRMGLKSSTKVNQFSKGNRNALALVCALAHRPDVLILDEPTSGLDPAARSEAFDLLREFMAEEGKTVLFSTHLLDDVEALADQVLFLAGGRVQEVGTPQELTDRYHLVRTPGRETGLIGSRQTGSVSVGLTTEPELWRGRPDTLIERPTLEEVFVHLIRGETRE